MSLRTKRPRISPGPALFNQALSCLRRGRSRGLVLLFVFPVLFRAFYGRIRRRSRRRYALRGGGACFSGFIGASVVGPGGGATRSGGIGAFFCGLIRASGAFSGFGASTGAVASAGFFTRAAFSEVGAVAFVVSVGAEVTGPLSFFFFSGGGVASSVIPDEGGVLVEGGLSPDFFLFFSGGGVGAVTGAVEEDGVVKGAAFSVRLFLFFSEGAAGVVPGVVAVAGLAVGATFSVCLSLRLSLALAGVVAGVAATDGLAEVTGGAEAVEGAAGEAPAGLCAVSVLSRGLIVGGGIFFASSLFIFAFKSSCAFGSETEVQPCSIVGFWIFSFTTLGAIGVGGF